MSKNLTLLVTTKLLEVCQRECEATTLVSMGMFDAPILSQATQDVCKPLTTVRQVPVGGVIMYHEE